MHFQISPPPPKKANLLIHRFYIYFKDSRWTCLPSLYLTGFTINTYKHDATWKVQCKFTLITMFPSWQFCSDKPSPTRAVHVCVAVVSSLIPLCPSPSHTSSLTVLGDEYARPVVYNVNTTPAVIDSVREMSPQGFSDVYAGEWWCLLSGKETINQ